jgi:branched-chain amino acid transport system permease protein
MTFADGLQYGLSGVTNGSIYAIVGIGFNVIYNTTGIINFAQGEFVVIGALVAVSLATVMPTAPAVALAVVAMAALGALVELVFIRWIKAPTVLRLIVITIGVAILLREGALHVWGMWPRALPPFSGEATGSIALFGAYLKPQILWVLGLCACAVVGLSLFFKLTATGRAMRACAANRTAARLCGVDVRRMVTLSFVLSAAIGALAGCAISPVAQIRYDMGATYAIKGFTVAVLGGLGNSMAAVAAGLLLGLIEAFSIVHIPLAYQDAVSAALLLGILVVKPSGLFGDRGASALKEF